MREASLDGKSVLLDEADDELQQEVHSLFSESARVIIAFNDCLSDLVGLIYDNKEVSKVEVVGFVQLVDAL